MILIFKKKIVWDGEVDGIKLTIILRLSDRDRDFIVLVYLLVNA